MVLVTAHCESRVLPFPPTRICYTTPAPAPASHPLCPSVLTALQR